MGRGYWIPSTWVAEGRAITKGKSALPEESQKAVISRIERAVLTLLVALPLVKGKEKPDSTV